MSGPPRIAILGGGIAGLSTAYFLEKSARERGLAIECRLFEAAPIPGGVITTERCDGFLLDTGPDSLFKGKPAAIDLAREIDLGGELLEAGRQELPTLIYSRGKLRPLPAGLETLSPTQVLPFLMSGLVSFTGKARMLMEPLVARREGEGDESVAGFVRRRFGAEAADKIAGPLFAGIHAGDPDRLSVRSTFPRLVEMERKYGSLANAVRVMRSASHSTRTDPNPPGVADSSRRPAGGKSRPGPPFVSFKGGIRRIVEGLQASLRSVRVETGCEVERLDRVGGGYSVVLKGREAWEADACVVALPAGRAASVVNQVAPGSAEALKKIRYASSATVFLGYRSVDTGPLPGSTGFLIPFGERRRIFGCTFVSNKFAGRAPDGCVLLRAFVGGAVDEARAEIPDDAMVTMVREELAALIGLGATPILIRVARWPKANPQYEIGHHLIVEAVDRGLRGQPRLVVTGSGLRGVGIPDGVASGRLASSQILESLRSPSPVP